ncbi:hypothetical protein [Enterobacter cloacae]|uniref:Uncharacterized protein n=1 Tax=Enterobacter cloacae TaxID=550 RepID=A0A3R9B053_ENTCL|nr:hypothetical protein [Enterobacter cloacae]RSB25674.1 hypothetical protein EGK68_23850 [Enterobacter cloacae]
MNHLVLRALAGMTLLAASAAGMAATMDITASFTPSMDKPENNTFTNNTPQSGYCKTWPNLCTHGIFSIALPVTTSITHSISQNNQPRDGVYFGLPGAMRNIMVTNSETNNTTQISFRVNLISAKMHFPTGQDQKSWNGGSFVYAPSPCTTTGVAMGSNTWYSFAWKVPASNVACYKTSTVDRTGPTSLSEISIGYEMTTPDPLKMEAGIYTGSLTLSVGPGGDIDFGDNYQASDTELTINFTLSVNHELKLTTTAENQSVSLQPCAPGRVCTEDEGQAGWERWMVSRVTPQLTGRSNFNLSSSGAFTVYLECEQHSGSDCALRSDKMPSQTVPVQMLLTLPDNIVDSVTGSTVSKRRLQAGRDLTKNVFVTKTFGQNRAGSIDFLVGQKDVDTMLTTRPDTYRGAVTVIFDPKIY